MRVAFDGRDLASPALRGMTRYLLGLTKSLASQGVEVVLLTHPQFPINAAHLAAFDFEMHEIPARRMIHWEQIAVPRALRRLNCDVYHAACERGLPLRAGCPRFMTIHSVTDSSYRDLIRRDVLPGPITRYLPHAAKYPRLRWAYWYLRSQMAAACKLFTPSEFAKEEIVRLHGISPSKVVVTPLALAQEFQSAKKPAHDREATLQRLGVRLPFLLFVGGFEPHKNPQGLLRLMALLRKTNPELSLVLVGTGEPPATLRVYGEKELGLPGDSVVYLHDLGEDLVDLYDAAEAFVSLSWRESFGLPALEATSRGLPVVASKWGATPEVVGDWGVYVDPDDEMAAVDAISLILRTSAKTVSSSQRARRYAWQLASEHTLNAYQEGLHAATVKNELL